VVFFIFFNPKVGVHFTLRISCCKITLSLFFQIKKVLYSNNVEPSWEIERRHRELQRHSRKYRVIRDRKYKAREIRLRYREI
jgi:hypothetical protein